MCNKLHHPEISPEQGASKTVKISQQIAKLWRKLKWLVFFWDTVYTTIHHTSSEIKVDVQSVPSNVVNRVI